MREGGKGRQAAREIFQKGLTFMDKVLLFAEKCRKKADSVV